MMGRLNHDQGEFFYSFRLDEAVPDDHPVRAIAAVLDLSWVHAELAPFYPKIGRPSIDPVLMIRMLIVGYAFAIRSEKIPDHSAFSRIRHERFRESDMFRRVFERVVEACIAAGFAKARISISRSFNLTNCDFQPILDRVKLDLHCRSKA